MFFFFPSQLQTGPAYSVMMPLGASKASQRGEMDKKGSRDLATTQRKLKGNNGHVSVVATIKSGIQDRRVTNDFLRIYMCIYDDVRVGSV
jgi:hypothetical protein